MSALTHSRWVIISWQHNRDPTQQPTFLPFPGTHVCHGSLVDTWGPKLDVLMGLCGWLSGPRCHLHYQRHTEEARCPAQIQPSACHRGPQGAGPAPSVCFSYKELATPVPAVEGRGGGYYLCRPQGRSPETLSKPSPSPQYGGPIPKGVSLALLGLHLNLLFWNAPPTRCLPEACPSPAHQAWKMPREQARQLNKISKGNGQS